MYIPISAKFGFSLTIAVAWLLFCTWFSMPWINDLAGYIGATLAFIVIFLIALLPGFMNVFLLAAYLIDKRPKAKAVTEWPDVTVLIPAYNEEKQIAETVHSIAIQQYPGKIHIIVIDNNSTDKTFEILQGLKISNLTVTQEQKKGKSHALNKGFTLVKTPYVLTVDADTYLLVDAIKELMIRMLSVPKHTAAVAGSVYVRNSRASFIARLQEWDYFHSIAVIKRMQSLFQGTLVAQGSLSLYRTSCIAEINGWPDTVGEDIVLTWALLAKDYRVDFSEDGIGFTTVPTTYKQFFMQRSRWARGMIEAFVTHPKVLFKRRLSTFMIWWDLLFPAIDTTYSFIFLPGVIAACFGYFLIAGPMTLAVLPIIILLNMVWFHGQKHTFTENELHVRRNRSGFILFMLFYYPIMVPACIYGYLSEIFKASKVWGTK